MRCTAGAVLISLCSVPAAARERHSLEPAAEPAPPPRPTWRFRDVDRPIKVVVLAGSIGAWPRKPYAEWIGTMCSAVEVKNLSKTGFGAYALKKRFKEQVAGNPYLRRRSEDHEYWLVFQGGLNSVASPERTNKHIRDLFVLAHRKRFGVVGLTLTPWGDDSDRRRWRGIKGLRYYDFTKQVVDFVMGRLTPKQALGNYRLRRPDADGPWSDDELADVRVDLYDSDLRDQDAPLRELEPLREALVRDKNWARRHAKLDEMARSAKLEEDASRAAQLPRWFLEPSLRSFDHIHPNAEGHRRIAQTMCPSLPENWRCDCSASMFETSAETQSDR